MTSVSGLSADLLKVLSLGASFLGTVVIGRPRPEETRGGQRSEIQRSYGLRWQDGERGQIKQVKGWIHTWSSSVGLSVNRENKQRSYGWCLRLQSTETTNKHTHTQTNTYTHTPVDPAHCLRTLPLHWDHCHHSADGTDSTTCSYKTLKSS